MRFNRNYVRVNNLIKSYQKNKLIWSKFIKLEWLYGLQEQLESILSFEKLETDRYGHGIIALKYSKEDKKYLQGFNYENSIDRISRMREMDENYLTIYSANYIDEKITKDDLKELQKAMNNRYSINVIKNYLENIMQEMEHDLKYIL